jgi:hypothetical protein
MTGRSGARSTAPLPTSSRSAAWAAYAACACALLYAVPSFYWAFGGTAGLDTVGGRIEELGRAGGPRAIALGPCRLALRPGTAYSGLSLSGLHGCSPPWL